MLQLLYMFSCGKFELLPAAKHQKLIIHWPRLIEKKCDNAGGSFVPLLINGLIQVMFYI